MVTTYCPFPYTQLRLGPVESSGLLGAVRWQVQRDWLGTSKEGWFLSTPETRGKQVVKLAVLHVRTLWMGLRWGKSGADGHKMCLTSSRGSRLDRGSDPPARTQRSQVTRAGRRTLGQQYPADQGGGQDTFLGDTGNSPAWLSNCVCACCAHFCVCSVYGCLCEHLCHCFSCPFV